VCICLCMSMAQMATSCGLKSCRNLVSCEESMLSHFYHDFCISIFYIIFFHPPLQQKRVEHTNCFGSFFLSFLLVLIYFFWWKQKLNKNPNFFIFCRQKLSSCYCCCIYLEIISRVSFSGGNCLFDWI
jgi:hypothetical protein